MRFGLFCLLLAGACATSRPPNVVLIVIDDLGYADLGVTGAKGYATPHLDRMAAEGTRLSSFYVAQAVCSASRAAIMTGRYPQRVGILGALGPNSKTGIADSEVTIAELMKARGYATAIYGKWHLGDAPKFLPTRHGFDEYYGLPYSNDMWPRHPQRPEAYPPLPLIEGDKVIAHDPDQTQLTTDYTRRAVSFIERNRERPFFLYLPHAMVHVPLHVSDKHRGKTQRGLFGDAMAEVDWSVGEVLATLARLGIDRETLVVFTSDNGPWLTYGDHAGSALPLREGKGTTFEGGVRVPAIFRWPGRIPAGRVVDEMALTMDLLPTFARLAGATVPTDRTIDGRDIWPLFEGGRTPHDAFFYHWGPELQAVRSGRFKLHLPHKYSTPSGHATEGRPVSTVPKEIALSLYDVVADPAETTDLAAQRPEEVSRLKALADRGIER